jgi:hypothetical protein
LSSAFGGVVRYSQGSRARFKVSFQPIPSTERGDKTLHMRCENRDFTRFSRRSKVSWGQRPHSVDRTHDSAGDTNDRHPATCRLDRSSLDTLHHVHCISAGQT